jgi:hypothetical protein
MCHSPYVAALIVPWLLSRWLHVCMQEALAHEREKRAADRSGRIRAEQKLKQLNLQLAQLTALAQVSAAIDIEVSGSLDSAAEGAEQTSSGQQQIGVFPFAPIGVLRSCFDDR